MKRFFGIFLILLGLVAAGAGVWLWQSSSPLVTPFWRALRPDLTRELSVKIGPALKLDFSSSQPVNVVKSEIKYLVFDPASGRVYASSRSDEIISPASFTKLLTTMVALDVATPTALLEATQTSINKEPTILGLKLGEKLTLDELILASIATSANDAAATIAEGIANLYRQQPDFFVDLMNQKAFLLGMNQSHFVNPEGYDSPQQFSTLNDLAKMVINVLGFYPQVVAAGAADRQDLVKDNNHGHYYLPNWNGLLKVYPGVNGLKIAYTETAGYSTIVSASRSGKTLVALVSGAESIEERDMVAARLLDAAFGQENITAANIGPEQLKIRYQEWKDLAAQIRAELKLLENKTP